MCKVCEYNKDRGEENWYWNPLLRTNEIMLGRVGTIFNVDLRISHEQDEEETEAAIDIEFNVDNDREFGIINEHIQICYCPICGRKLR